jgi:hypothetical protein
MSSAAAAQDGRAPDFLTRYLFDARRANLPAPPAPIGPLLLPGTTDVPLSFHNPPPLPRAAAAAAWMANAPHHHPLSQLRTAAAAATAAAASHDGMLQQHRVWEQRQQLLSTLLDPRSLAWFHGDANAWPYGGANGGLGVGRFVGALPLPPVSALHLRAAAAFLLVAPAGPPPPLGNYYPPHPLQAGPPWFLESDSISPARLLGELSQLRRCMDELLLLPRQPHGAAIATGTADRPMPPRQQGLVRALANAARAALPGPDAGVTLQGAGASALESWDSRDAATAVAPCQGLVNAPPPVAPQPPAATEAAEAISAASARGHRRRRRADLEADVGVTTSSNSLFQAEGQPPRAPEALTTGSRRKRKRTGRVGPEMGHAAGTAARAVETAASSSSTTTPGPCRCIPMSRETDATHASGYQSLLREQIEYFGRRGRSPGEGPGTVPADPAGTGRDPVRALRPT